MKKCWIIFVLILGICLKVQAGIYDKVDQRAKTVPFQYETNLSKLVDYLIKPYKQNEELKARVIFAWIVYHIDYDGFKAGEILGTHNKKRKGRVLNSGDAFETRVGICGDIADLFLKMANRAGLRVERIEGFAGSDLTVENFESAAHAWNAVRINHEWRFIDATWGMSGDYIVFDNLKNAKEHKEEIKKRHRQKERPVKPNRSINDFWFLTPSAEMIKTHFPNNSKWQLLDKPVKVREIFHQNSEKNKKQKK